MSTFKDWKEYKTLKKRGNTNSSVKLLKNEKTGELLVRKTIYGLDQPLYETIFKREMNALNRLNKCDNIVKILGYEYLIVAQTKEKVGVIYLEYISGIELERIQIENLTSKEKFAIIRQLLNAIESSHSNGIIHRDINPNNIMIFGENQVKLIDFGICKINNMINSQTVYNFGTNAYSAPEVHQHSENASEKSDFYSLGAVIYYLFTGKKPPLAIQFQNELSQASGIDIKLKPIIKKLVAENPDDRYKNIFELKSAFLELFMRFLDLDKVIIMTAIYERINDLKNFGLLPHSRTIKQISEIDFSNNFLDLYAFYEEEQGTELYIFLGANFLAKCVFDTIQNVFDVVRFEKVTPIKREKLKKQYAKIEGKIKFIDKKYAHWETKNNSIEIKNIIIDFYRNYISKKNVDYEYRKKYGVWRELLELLKENIEKNVVRLEYDSYEEKDNLISFKLAKGTFVDEECLNKEQVFVYEKKVEKKKDKVKLVTIGTYENDIYEENCVILKIRKQDNVALPKNGFICLDYRKDKINIERQLEALNILEKEEYQCTFHLKEILSGVMSPSTNIISRTIHMINKKLDLPQKTAVEKALATNSIAIIQGPPGTGKTNVIIEIILQILKENKKNSEIEPKKILLVSQSHPAVDKMLEDLIRESKNEKLDLLRIGKDEKLSQEVRTQYSINDIREKWCQAVTQQCNEYAQNLLNEVGISLEEFNEYFSKLENSKVKNVEFSVTDKLYIENFQEKTKDLKEEHTRKILEIQKEWTERLKKCNEVEFYIIKSTVVVAGTCIGFLSNRIIRDIHFDYLIVDEAAKATFPELAVSLNKANKIILVGDHQQLPPVLNTELIKNNEDKIDIKNLSHGIFEKMYDMFPQENKHRLTIQYRMHPTIGTLISHVFYSDEILNGVESQDRDLHIQGYENIAIEWISTSKIPSKKRYEKKFESNEFMSYQNYLEKKIIEEKLLELDSKLTQKTKTAVITAYRSQKYILQTMVKQHSFKYLEIDVDTVDAFQGNQKDIIIYSTVRSSSNKYGIGFLKSEARINVAFSRARCLLIIVGDKNFLNNYQIRGNKFPEIIKYITENDECRIVEIAGDEE